MPLYIKKISFPIIRIQQKALEKGRSDASGR